MKYLKVKLRIITKEKGEQEMKESEAVKEKIRGREKTKKYEIDMCNGPLFGKIIVFAIPLMLSGILQLLFNAADMIVVGRFSGSDALAAVGSTSSLNNLIINFFIGLSVGSNVMVARYYGAGKKKELSEMVHTAITTALVCGMFLGVFGICVSRAALQAMGTPAEVIEQSVLYMCIYFLCMPFLLVYNFGSAILRAVGDTKRPLYYLFYAGVINVVLNLILVIVFHMGVAGVAIATVASQVVSAVLVVRCLMQTEGDCRLELNRLGIKPRYMLEIVRIGLPAGLQSICFNISNVLIQSSVNSFGAVAMAGNTASQNIEGFISTSNAAFYQAAMSFTGQNYGAHKFKRIKRIALICMSMSLTVGFIVGSVGIFFGEPLLGLYASDPEVIAYGMLRLGVLAMFYCIGGMMDVVVGLMRGMGYAMVPMFVTLSGACLFRIIWIYTVFQKIHTLPCLYSSYPISWTLTLTVQFICFVVIYRRVIKKAGL